MTSWELLFWDFFLQYFRALVGNALTLSLKRSFGLIHSLENITPLAFRDYKNSLSLIILQNSTKFHFLWLSHSSKNDLTWVSYYVTQAALEQPSSEICWDFVRTRLYMLEWTQLKCWTNIPLFVDLATLMLDWHFVRLSKPLNFCLKFL